MTLGLCLLRLWKNLNCFSARDTNGWQAQLKPACTPRLDQNPPRLHCPLASSQQCRELLQNRLHFADGQEARGRIKCFKLSVFDLPHRSSRSSEDGCFIGFFVTNTPPPPEQHATFTFLLFDRYLWCTLWLKPHWVTFSLETSTLSKFMRSLSERTGAKCWSDKQTFKLTKPRFLEFQKVVYNCLKKLFPALEAAIFGIDLPWHEHSNKMASFSLSSEIFITTLILNCAVNWNNAKAS